MPIMSLPRRIAAVMFGAIGVFALTVVLSTFLLARAFDREALDNSRSQIHHAVEEAAEVVEDLSASIAAPSATGEPPGRYALADRLLDAAHAEGVVLVSAWGPAAGTGAGRDAVAPETRRQVEQRIAAAGEEPAVFFDWSDGRLRVLGAVPFDAADPSAGAVVVGAEVEETLLHYVEESFLLSGVAIVTDQSEDAPSLPLKGADGRTVAWVVWDVPHPGSALLARLAPWLALVLLVAMALGGLAIGIAQRSARALVRAERHSSHAARTDALTGLPNRAAFSELLDEPAGAGGRAILFLDVDDFKRVNDSIGHAAGDAVIAEVALRLTLLSGTDTRLARIGGDEFVILLTGPGAARRAEAVARSAERALAAPVEVLGHQLRLGASIGYAVQTSDGMDGAALLRQADLAMYEAKRRQGKGAVAFDQLIEKAVHDARTIEEELRLALDRGGEFSVAYQPIATAEGGLSRAEALARWVSPVLGSVPPDRFIAVAERSGLMIRLGEVLLRLICDDLSAYPDLRVGINVSPLQLMAPTFVEGLLGSLAERGIHPSRIEIELTEAVVVDNPALAAERLRELRAAGFSTALDDFGTGYSSIGYLQQMGFDTLKVDRSFVSGFCEAPDRLALVNAMILLAHALGLRVTCEGVETDQELRTLRELGCDLQQGYVLDRPLAIDAVAARWLSPTRNRAAVA